MGVFILESEVQILKSKDFEIHYINIQACVNNQLIHYHDSYELAFFIKANLNIFIKDINYSINDGDMIFINEYDIHKIIYNQNIQYSRYVINFKKEFLMPVLEHLQMQSLLQVLSGKLNGKIILKISQKNEMIEMFNSLVKLNTKIESKGNGIEEKSLIKAWLIIILTKINELNLFLPNKKEVQVQKIIKYIDKNYANNLTLDKMQEVFNLSKFHISHIFKEITGFSVIEYIQYTRVIEAQKMLKESKDIIDVCFSCGFTNIPHFYRVFKKISKVTPYKFKKL